MSLRRLMMVPLLFGAVLMSALAPPVPERAAVTRGAPPMRFVAVDVLIDSDSVRLGAWQIEYEGSVGADADGRVMLVGVEGGEHPAYTRAPHYDPAALSGGRIVIAAYTTADDAPSGVTRVARLHLSIPQGGEFVHGVRLIAAGDSDGDRIEARVWVAEITPESNTKSNSTNESEGSEP